MSSSVQVDLSRFDNTDFDRGRPTWVEFLWRLVSAVVFESFCFPMYAPKRFLLRMFGARIGRGVLIKPKFTVTFPWKLSIGDDSWIGEEVRIDSPDRVEIGANVCISQRAYLCAGSHNSRSATFDLVTKMVRINDGAWVAAGAIVGPGVTVGSHALVAMGSVVTKDVADYAIVAGNPASFRKTRIIEARP